MAWIGALIVGLVLGLLGSGGSILTTPILKYLLGHEHKPALAEGIIIVGVIAVSGLVPAARAGRVDWRSVFLFGVPAMAGMYVGVTIAGHLRGPVLFLLFAVVMLLAAGLMIRTRKGQPDAGAVGSGRPRNAPGPHVPSATRPKWFLIPLEGLGVGALTGLVGVGGGFIIVPALVLLGGLSMHVAVGTSLAIIALKAVPGTLKYLDVLSAGDQTIDWVTVGIFCTVGVVGSQIGMRVGGMLDQRVLKRVFAALMIAMAAYIVYRESRVLVAAPAQGPSAPESIGLGAPGSEGK